MIRFLEPLAVAYLCLHFYSATLLRGRLWSLVGSGAARWLAPLGKLQRRKKKVPTPGLDTTVPSPDGLVPLKRYTVGLDGTEGDTPGKEVIKEEFNRNFTTQSLADGTTVIKWQADQKQNPLPSGNEEADPISGEHTNTNTEQFANPLGDPDYREKERLSLEQYNRSYKIVSELIGQVHEGMQNTQVEGVMICPPENDTEIPFNRKNHLPMKRKEYG